jgi:hypothetical protein
LERVDKWRGDEDVMGKILSQNPKVLDWWKSVNKRII